MVICTHCNKEFEPPVRSVDSIKIWDNVQPVGHIEKGHKARVYAQLVARDGVKYLQLYEMIYRVRSEKWGASRASIAIPLATLIPSPPPQITKEVSNVQPYTPLKDLIDIIHLAYEESGSFSTAETDKAIYIENRWRKKDATEVAKPV